MGNGVMETSITTPLNCSGIEQLNRRVKHYESVCVCVQVYDLVLA